MTGKAALRSRSRSTGREQVQAEQPWRDPEKELHAGCKVRLRGVNVQRNGQLGVLEGFCRDSGRWRVRLLTSGQKKDLRPEFLVLEEPAAYRPPKAKQVEVPLPAERTSLHVGCVVQLLGLKNAVELNGKCGVLEAFIEETGRWRVRLGDGQKKDLKPDNLEYKLESATELAEGPDGEKVPVSGRGQSQIQVQPGETCGPGGRFLVQEKLGEGSFSSVFCCRDTQAPGVEYAVKFTHSDLQTQRALDREVKLMGRLCTETSSRDPDGCNCLLRLAFFEAFEYRGRLAVVFERMKCNLRTALERYGQGRGLPLLPTVRNFGRDLFRALRALHLVGVVHCDVKPDNLLLSMDHESIKLCDFGSAQDFVSLQQQTGQVQPRHYRAPEVMLGQGCGPAIDIWSGGATLCELATGQVLFVGENNNDMLHEMLKVCGSFPPDFATHGALALNHFRVAGPNVADFLNARGDMALGSINPRIMPLQTFDPPPRPLPYLLDETLKVPPHGVAVTRHMGLVRHLIDLLGHCILPDPAGRVTAGTALGHSFFQPGAL